MTDVNPRSITDAERPFLEQFTIEDQADLIERVRSLGYGEQIALSMAGWLALKAARKTDRTSAPAKARYRRILREVQAEAAKVDDAQAIPGYLKGADQLANEAA